MGGEEDGAGEGRASESGKELLPLEGCFVSNDSLLEGKGPCANVVEPPAAAREVVFETVHVAFIDRSTDRRICSIEDRDGDGQGEKEE